MSEQQDLPAGGFSSWLRRIWHAQLQDSGIEVPCGGCVACCRSSYFVHVAPDETQTLARIPGELLFAAPDLPVGNVLMGYDEDGRCPMLRDAVCSIYGDRPLTCRNYDCRVYAAAGIDADRPAITRRARRWAFSYLARDDRDEHAAVQAAARFLREHGECFPGGVVPADPAQVAIVALKVYEIFVDREDGHGTARRPSLARDAEIAAAVVTASEKFEARRGWPAVRPG